MPVASFLIYQQQLLFPYTTKNYNMPKWLRALIAGYGAKKLGGGCLSTILIFVVIYYALGTCNRPAASPQRTQIKTEQQQRVTVLQNTRLVKVIG
jgi:hypothetical protein